MRSQSVLYNRKASVTYKNQNIDQKKKEANPVITPNIDMSVEEKYGNIYIVNVRPQTTRQLSNDPCGLPVSNPNYQTSEQLEKQSSRCQSTSRSSTRASMRLITPYSYFDKQSTLPSSREGIVTPLDYSSTTKAQFSHREFQQPYNFQLAKPQQTIVEKTFEEQDSQPIFRIKNDFNKEGVLFNLVSKQKNDSIMEKEKRYSSQVRSRKNSNLDGEQKGEGQSDYRSFQNQLQRKQDNNVFRNQKKKAKSTILTNQKKRENQKLKIQKAVEKHYSNLEKVEQDIKIKNLQKQSLVNKNKELIRQQDQQYLELMKKNAEIQQQNFQMKQKEEKERKQILKIQKAQEFKTKLIEHQEQQRELQLQKHSRNVEKFQRFQERLKDIEDKQLQQLIQKSKKYDQYRLEFKDFRQSSNQNKV